MTFLSDKLVIKYSPERQWGVYARRDIPAHTKIECSPVIVMSEEERELLDQTKLYNYIFDWNPEAKQVAMAMGYIPIYNHASPSNAEYIMNYAEQVITIVTVRDILQGEEIFINYQGDFDDITPVWFEIK